MNELSVTVVVVAMLPLAEGNEQASCHGGDEDLVEGAAFMAKPFGPGAFVSRVRVALGESVP